MAQGCYYLWNSLKTDPVTLATIAAALGFACWQRKPRRVCVAAGIALYLLYVVRIGGDFMSGRYLTAPLLAAVGVLVSVPWSADRAWAAAAAVVLLGLLSARPLPGRGRIRSVGPREVAPHCGRAGHLRRAGVLLPGDGAVAGLAESAAAHSPLPLAAEGQRLRPSLTARGEGDRRPAEHRLPRLLCRAAGPSGGHIGPGGSALGPAAAHPDPCWRIGHFLRPRPPRLSGNHPHREEPAPRAGPGGILRSSGVDHARQSLGSAPAGGDLEHESRPLRTPAGADETRDPCNAARSFSAYVRSACGGREVQPHDCVRSRRAGGLPLSGALYAMYDRLDEAIRDFDRVVELEPQSEIAYAYRGDLHARHGDWAAAIRDCDRAIKLQSYNVPAYKCRAVVYADTGKLGQAIDDFNRARGVRYPIMSASISCGGSSTKNSAIGNVPRTIFRKQSFWSRQPR